MKLIIQIPCFNEEAVLLKTLKSIPEKIQGIDCIEVLIINDGSTDKTAEIASFSWANYIVSHSKNLGLARAFDTGLKKALELGGDIIVNLDADNQYRGEDIPKLIAPILNKKADITIGARPIEKIRSFSFTKKVLQKLGSFVVRKITNTSVMDAPSGFRAFSREAAIRMNIFDNYTYTLETIIQAQNKGLVIESVPIEVNEDLRPSRLVKSNFNYICRSICTIMHFVIIYKPFRFFMRISLLLLIMGGFLGARFVYFYINGFGRGHIQSLILCAILILVGVQSLFFAVIADLLAINRKLLEDIQIRTKKNV